MTKNPAPLYVDPNGNTHVEAKIIIPHPHFKYAAFIHPEGKKILDQHNMVVRFNVQHVFASTPTSFWGRLRTAYQVFKILKTK